MTTLTDDDLDTMVRRARNIARPDRKLPDKSAVRNLAEFARMTGSLEELLLYIEYQGSRASKNVRDVFTETANATRKIADGDIDRARRFLALLVRAVAIAHNTGGGDRRSGDAGNRGRGGR